MAKVEIAVILDGQGGELERQVIEVDDEADDSGDRADAAIQGVIRKLVLAPGDTIRIVDQTPEVAG